MADTLNEALGEVTPSDDIVSDKKVIIDTANRTISAPNPIVFGVYNDKKVARIQFTMNRFYEGLDLSEFELRINYRNAAGYDGVFFVDNPEVTDDTIEFEWLLDRGVFVKEGTVIYSICMMIVDGEGKVSKEYNTTIATGSVLVGLEVDESPSPEAYSILAHMKSLEEQAEDSAVNASAYAEDAREALSGLTEDLADLETEVDDRLSNFSGTIANIRTDVDTFKDDVTEQLEKIDSMYTFKGSVANYASLPTSDLNVGDVYNTNDTGMNYAWTGSSWDSLGQVVVFDTSLTVAGRAADAKAVGDALADKVDKETGKGLVAVDSALSTSSTNPVQNSVIKAALDDKVDKENGKGLVSVDSSLSTSSTNPVQNSVIKAALDNKVDKETGKGLVSVDSAMSDSSTNPVQNKIVKAYIESHDSKNETTTFTSSDAASPTSWSNVDVLASGEKHSSFLSKISTMFKNIRYLYKMLGTTDISSIGGGTVTGALSKLNTDKESSSNAVLLYTLCAQTITETETTISTFGSRDISKFDGIVATYRYGNMLRASTITIMSQFQQYPISVSYVDSIGAQRWIEVAYVSDTSIKAKTSANGSGTLYLYGIGLSKTLS